MDAENTKDVVKLNLGEREYRDGLDQELRMDPLILKSDLQRNLIKQIQERNLLMNQGNHS